MKKEILFISHYAGRTGAPIVFLNFLRWFKENTNIPFRIILKNTGELESEFSKLAPTLVFEQSPQYGLYFRTKRYFGFVDTPEKKLKKWLGKSEIGLIYSNTLTNSRLLEILTFLKCPVITHVHELEYAIRLFAGLEQIEQLKKHTTHYIACAEAVKSNLINNHKIPSTDVTVIHEFISVQPNLTDQSQKILHDQLKLPNDAFIIGASGTTDWRKGAELFIQLAHIVKRRIEGAVIHFVWIGGQCEGIEYFALEQDIYKAGLSGIVHFIGSKPNPLDYFIGFDIFALMSREDPYPLVCLEVASLGKPIICFDKAGGEPEFVEDDCGFVVPYLNLDVMVDRIIELYQLPSIRQQLGENAAKKVRERHDIETEAPKILKVIEQYFKTIS